MMLVTEAYDDSGSAAGSSMEDSAAEFCKELYTLCLDMVSHVEEMGNKFHIIEDITNMDGFVLIEALAYKVTRAQRAA